MEGAWLSPTYGKVNPVNVFLLFRTGAADTSVFKAIAAFAALAERLDALVAERARPWWRRLAR
jgi:hypothetical protein